MSKELIVRQEVVMSKIYQIRGQKVMLDSDLAELYGVENKQLKRQVRRNISRFPDDFMFELTQEEHESLRSQIGTLNRGQHFKYSPYVFTEQGVAQLSAVLNSERAIMVNIQIIRIFTKMREMLLTHKDLLLKLEAIEKEVSSHDEKIALIFEYLQKLEQTNQKELEQKNRSTIGFKPSKGSKN